MSITSSKTVKFATAAVAALKAAVPGCSEADFELSTAKSRQATGMVFEFTGKVSFVDSEGKDFKIEALAKTASGDDMSVLDSNIVSCDKSTSTITTINLE